jgi:hypothetical protein
MWREGLLYRVDAVFIALALAPVMFAAAWAAYRVALRRKDENETERERLSDIGPVEAAVAGLLALVLAFSFSLAAQRFDARQSVVVAQAKAIEATFLRCALLDRDDRAYCEDRLRAYVDLLVAYNAAPRDQKKIDAVVGQIEDIERELWARVAAVARDRPTIVNANMLTALSDVIDRRVERIASMRIVVPEEVTVVLLVLCVLWAAVAGYAYGLKRNQKRAAWVIFSVLVALIVYVTIDLDQPRRGIIRLGAGNQSMMDLQTSMRSGAP